MSNFFKAKKYISEEKLKLYIVSSILIFLFILSFVLSFSKEKDINKHKKITAGLVLNANAGRYFDKGNYGKGILFKYYTNSRYYKSNDSYGDGYPNKIRLGKPEIGQYYPVEYDSLNPDKARILITKQPLNPKKLINDGVYVNGKITKVLEGHYPALDLFIDYNFNNQIFSFRTRLHKDSINCSNLEECKNKKTIRLKVSKKYPFFNDLYFKSSDRQNKKYQHLD